MFHYFVGKITRMGNKHLLSNDSFGIELTYAWNKKTGEFYIHPYLDDNKKTISYFGFDTWEQKNVFEDLIKINGIWPKTGFNIAQLPKENLQNAIKTFDVKFFQAVPGIGPKTAKKILLELKGSFELDDIKKMDADQRFYKDIIKSLKGFGYDTERVKSTLQRYEGTISKENMWEVIKRVIAQI